MINTVKYDDRNQDETGPLIGEIRTGCSVRLTPAANGGWVVFAESRVLGQEDQIVGAYTDAASMLEALRKSLG